MNAVTVRDPDADHTPSMPGHELSGVVVELG
jgi:hypothetical protein